MHMLLNLLLPLCVFLFIPSSSTMLEINLFFLFISMLHVTFNHCLSIDTLTVCKESKVKCWNKIYNFWRQKRLKVMGWSYVFADVENCNDFLVICFEQLGKLLETFKKSVLLWNLGQLPSSQGRIDNYYSQKRECHLLLSDLHNHRRNSKSGRPYVIAKEAETSQRNESRCESSSVWKD